MHPNDVMICFRQELSGIIQYKGYGVKKPKVFISYSHKDQEIVSRIRESMGNLEVFNIFIDEKDVNIGDRLSDTFTTHIRNSDAFILFISKDSVKSYWVEYETSVAHKKLKNNKLHFLPVLLNEIPEGEHGRLSKMLPENIKVGDFTFPGSFETDFEKLIKSLREKLKIDNLDSALEKEINMIARLVNSDLDRYKDIIDNVFSHRLDEKLRDIKERVEQMQQLSYLGEKVLTETRIADIEREAKYDIWVITTHMENDDDDDLISENNSKGIKYTYLYPDSAILRNKIEKFREMHDGGNDFIPLKEDYILPFGELVIYDPYGAEDARGYIQLSRKNKIFVELDDRMLNQAISMTKKIIEKDN